MHVDVREYINMRLHCTRKVYNIEPSSPLSYKLTGYTVGFKAHSI